MASPTGTMPDTRRSAASIRGPGIVLGLGLGGFVDGIVLHQVLQWHHLVSNTQPPTSLETLRANVLADGLFHALTWIFVVVGIAWLWARARRGGWTWSWRHLLGWTLVGWGVFNMVEGLVDHHLLQIHRVRPEAANPLLWDLGFLGFGALLVVVGWALQRADSTVGSPGPLVVGSSPTGPTETGPGEPAC